MPDANELQGILREGRESRAVEFKESMSWTDAATQGKVVKWALAAANLADGGVLAFGLVPNAANTRHDAVGMSLGDYESFTQDDVQSTINAHATPHIDLSVIHLPTVDGRDYFVAVIVRQFADYPVICAADFVVSRPPPERPQTVVIKGRMYCRSRRQPETTEVQSPEDMRDIIELAINRGLERYFRQREIERRLEGPSAAERFSRQAEDLLR